VKTMRETELSMEAFLRECTPGWYNSECGKVIRPPAASFLELGGCRERMCNEDDNEGP
jgi:hypothetical protein